MSLQHSASTPQNRENQLQNGTNGVILNSEEKMSPYTFRPFKATDEEYQAIVDVWNSVWTDEKRSPENVKHHDDTRSKDKFWQRLVYEVDGRIVASGVYCQTWWFDNPNKYFFSIMVRPEYQNQGLGSAFYDHVYNILSQQPNFKLLTTDTREDKTASIQFLTKRGFKQEMRYPKSVIDVQQFEPEKYRPLIDKLNQEQVEILNLNELTARYEDYQRQLYDMEVEIEKDIPVPEPFKPPPFEEFQKGLFGSPNLYPEAFFVAVDNDQFVGLSALWKRPDKELLSTGLTGVLRSHRRRGLATALKATAIGFAKSKGIKAIDTDNEENNPMYDLNMQLGFKPTPAYLDFIKEIT